MSVVALHPDEAREELRAGAPQAGLRWQAANRAHLTAALAVVQATVAAVADSDGPEASIADLRAEADAIGAASPGPTALTRVVELFGLTTAERDTLLMCAAMDLVAGFDELCQRAGSERGRPGPTFGLALAALPEAHWSAVGPDAPLRRFRLLEVGAGDNLTASPLRIEERVLHYLAGVDASEPRLAGLITPVTDQAELMPSHMRVVDRMVATWGLPGSGRVVPLELAGVPVTTARAIARRAAARFGMALEAIAVEALPADPLGLEELAALWEREALLRSACLFVEAASAELEDPVMAVRLRRFVARLRAPLIIASGVGARRAPLDGVHVVDAEPIGFVERRDLWRSVLGDAAASLNGELDVLAGQFRLGPEAIRRAAAAAQAGDVAAPTAAADTAGAGRTDPVALWAAARREGRARLDDLAVRLDGTATWDDLVLPGPQRAILRDIAAHVRGRPIVDERWGFAAQGSRGLGINALFAGPSGTGKTLAAEVLGSELALDVYRIDLSQVVSKYIGETEKNLRRVFDAAEDSGAILLFDEADALFGKRSDVRDSHDRYANIEVSYLLQRTEAYRGLVVLTTNLKAALDPAFLRRLRFAVQFPFPDVAERAAIWRRMFPPQAPLGEIDFDQLARLSLAGGSIRNVALGAAFLAAASHESISTGHLMQAARSEYAKLERPFTEAEVAG